MIGLDTNGLVRHPTQGDPDQAARATREVEQVASKPWSLYEENWWGGGNHTALKINALVC